MLGLRYEPKGMVVIDLDGTLARSHEVTQELCAREGVELDLAKVNDIDQLNSTKQLREGSRSVFDIRCDVWMYHTHEIRPTVTVELLKQLKEAAEEAGWGVIVLSHAAAAESNLREEAKKLALEWYSVNYGGSGIGLGFVDDAKEKLRTSKNVIIVEDSTKLIPVAAEMMKNPGIIIDYRQLGYTWAERFRGFPGVTIEPTATAALEHVRDRLAYFALRKGLECRLKTRR